jgi:nicotinate-nucleotide pyrophosphorylase (carboxylating)
MTPQVDQTFALREAFEGVMDIALREDLGDGDVDADITTISVVPETLWGSASVNAKEAGVICGLQSIEATFRQLDGRVTWKFMVEDGDEVGPKTPVATIEGPVRPILVGERSFLNVVAHLSGIATHVRRFTRAAPDVLFTDTRKTLPGLRSLQKYAVRIGGASNHRFALWDGVLIKDTHIVAAGSVGEAVRRTVRATSLPVQAECTSLAEVDDALDAGAHAILLDNVGPEELAALTSHIKGRADHVLVEASGGVTMSNAAEIGATGVDRVSVGAFTHSSPALDLSLRLDRTWEVA